MARRRTRAQIEQEVQLQRGLVLGLPHHDLLLLAVAANTLAGTIDAAEVLRCDPEARDDAVRLRELAQLFLNANQARDFIEERAATAD